MDKLQEKYIDSREVAQMVGKEHNKLMRDIRNYTEFLNQSKIGHVEFFAKSTYKDGKGEARPCFLVSKKGCEFIAHKLTGAKGAEFTAKYIERFHEMEDTIKSNIMPHGKELLALAVIESQKIIEEQTARIEEMKPKEIFADSVSASKTSILIGDLAKLIKQNGVEIGQKRLFEWLRLNGYLIKRQGEDWNMPTQKSMNLKLFEIKETVINHSDGHTSIKKTVKVTGKGQIYFINKFLGTKGNEEADIKSK